jgi:outer membrane lipoprotein SlyB
MNRKLFLIIAAVITLGLFGCQSQKALTTPQVSPATPSAAKVQANYRIKRIADGDTITVVDNTNSLNSGYR